MSKTTIIIITILVIIIAIIPAYIWIKGVCLSFSAHPITGLLVLIAEPAPFVVGVADIFFDYNIAEVFTDKFIR